jgi:hypothetical protein
VPPVSTTFYRAQHQVYRQVLRNLSPTRPEMLNFGFEHSALFLPRIPMILIQTHYWNGAGPEFLRRRLLALLLFAQLFRTLTDPVKKKAHTSSVGGYPWTVQRWCMILDSSLSREAKLSILASVHIDGRSSLPSPPAGKTPSAGKTLDCPGILQHRPRLHV